MKITRDELRELIYEYKNDGNTFEGISNLLEKEHGIKRDRQSVHGIYKRYVERLKRDTEILRVDIDIINIAARNNFMSTIEKQVMEIDESVSRAYIKRAVEKFEDSINGVRDEMLDIVKSGLRTGGTKEDIIEAISYKGYEPSDKIYKGLIKEAFSDRILNSIERIIAQSIAHNGNNDVARELVKEFPTGNSVTVIKNKYI